MKTKVKLKDGCTIYQPITDKKWAYGYIDGYCRGADNCCYAIVVTEHNELEYVPIHAIVAYDTEKSWR